MDPGGPAQVADHGHETLDSWKEIAWHFRRSVRTVLRWERDRGLPVHRIPGGGKAAVFALKAELDAWKSQNVAHLNGDEPAPPAPTPPSRRAVAYWIAGALAMAAVVAALGWRSLSHPAPFPLRFTPLTSLPGEEVDPAWSPDGKTVAFAYRPEGKSGYDIFLMTMGAAAPRQLTRTPASERFPAWSPDSRHVAFIRNPGGEIWIADVEGGGARRITALSLSPVSGGKPLDWSRDGGSLIVSNSADGRSTFSLFEIQLSSGALRRLTSPPPGSIGDDHPALSPDGKSIAFTRYSTTRIKDIWIIDAPGDAPHRITSDERNISGLAWSGDGGHLLFVSDRGGSDPALWKVPAAGGSPELLTVLPPYSRMLSAAPGAGHIAYARYEMRSSIWNYDLGPAGAVVNSPTRLITSSRIQAHPQFSPGGGSIAFMSDRSGFTEIWVSRSDGGEPRRLTDLRGEGGAPRWSPDGSRIAFDMRVRGKHGIFTVSAAGGPAAALVADPYENGSPSWSHDGRWVYFLSNRSGRHEVWKVQSTGGQPLQVTHGGGAVAFEAPDGKTLYYARSRQHPGLMKKTLPDGPETLALPDYGWAVLGAFQVTGRGVYLLDRIERAGQSMPVIKLLPHDGGAARLLAVLDESAIPAYYSGGVTIWHPMSVSLDGRKLLITRLDHVQSTIMIAGGRH